jgi:hypothetical protein
VHASFSYVHAEGIQNEHLKNMKTDVHDEHVRQYAYEHARQFLTHMLSI